MHCDRSAAVSPIRLDVRQAMNGAQVLRSTFGFTDTKGKPNELGSCFSVVMEKPAFYSDLSHQV